MTPPSASFIDRARAFHRKDVEWNDRLFGLTPLHPSFWVLRRLRGAIRQSIPHFRGRLLDAGCGMSPYRAMLEPHVAQYVGLEWHPESGYRGNNADLYGHVSRVPLGTGTMDAVLCTEVLEHVPDPDHVLGELGRVLRPGGTLILTAPFVFPIHEERDYFRYTAQGFRALLDRQGFERVEVVPLGRAPTTLAVLTGLYLLDGCFLWNRWLYAFSIPLRPLLLAMIAVINVAAGIAERLLPGYNLPCNHLVIARRAAAETAARPRIAEPALSVR